MQGQNQQEEQEQGKSLGKYPEASNHKDWVCEDEKGYVSSFGMCNLKSWSIF